MSIQPAVLLIADIGGYTRFLNVNRTNLAHAQEVIAELLEAVIEGASRRWKLAKLEGDAAFFYSVIPESDAQLSDVVSEASRIRESFLRRRQEVAIDNVCSCEGCSQAANLKLKFVAHRGEIAFQKVKRYRELAGVDVILVHRMLKNSVPLSEYVLMTGALTDHVAPELRPHLQPLEEEFEGLGRLTNHYLDLNALAPERIEVRPNLGRRLLYMLRMMPRLLLYVLRLKSPTCKGFRNLSPKTGGVGDSAPRGARAA